MGDKSKIGWTNSTWNPVTGCTPVSPGCANCYAKRMAARLKGMGQKNYRNGFEVTCHDHMLEIPIGWRRPRIIFVCSMGDLFHKDVPDDFIERVFDIMSHENRHWFQVLTKRPERVAEMVSDGRLKFPRNVWYGTTTERQKEYDARVPLLLKVPAQIRFISVEPMLGPVIMQPGHLVDLDWVIVGGESGPGARPMKPGWVREIRNSCHEWKVPFFFKQWGGVNKRAAGRTLDGLEWSGMPRRA